MTAKILPLRPRKPVQAQGDECRCISCRSDLARVVPLADWPAGAPAIEPTARAVPKDGLTGSAGPDPQEQPVGTIVIAVAAPNGTRVRTFRMPGDRERVRTLATTASLQLIRLSLQGVEWGTG